MRKEYDFSPGTRGKFHQPQATLDLPVYLDDEIRAALEARAKAQQIDLSALVNQILKEDLARSTP